MELRQLATKVETTGRTLTGYAAVWDSPSRIITEKGKRFREVVTRGAFTDSLRSLPRGDVLALWNHAGVRPPLGRLTAGTLRLEEDSIGLRFSIDAPESAADILEAVTRGDVWGCSFGADVVEDLWTVMNGVTRRTMRRLDLYEVSLVIAPAYPSTSVVVRQWDADAKPIPRLETNRRRLKITGLDTGKPSPGSKDHAEDRGPIPSRESK